MRSLRAALVLLALLLAPALALAAGPLTAKQVEGFIAVAPELQKLGEAHADEFDAEAFETMNANAFMDALKAAGIADEFESLVKSHGFSDGMEAADVMRRVMTAYLVLDGGGDPRAEIKEMREQVEGGQSMTEEERKSFLDNLAQSEAAFADVDTDKPVVEPYAAQLMSIFDGLSGNSE